MKYSFLNRCQLIDIDIIELNYRNKYLYKPQERYPRRGTVTLDVTAYTI